MLEKLKSKKLGKNQQGFTIIEVMIVLAIAALILVIVFLAVPALQRSSRNTQRDTDASNALAALSNYVSNHNGQFPSADCAASAATCTFLSADNVKYGYYKPANVEFVTGPTDSDFTTWYNSGAPSGSNAAEKLFLVGDATCSSDGTTIATATSARQYAAVYGKEGGTPVRCVEG